MTGIYRSGLLCSPAHEDSIGFITDKGTVDEVVHPNATWEVGYVLSALYTLVYTLTCIAPQTG